jgi:hypothetical protein
VGRGAGVNYLMHATSTARNLFGPDLRKQGEDAMPRFPGLDTNNKFPFLPSALAGPTRIRPVT